MWIELSIATAFGLMLFAGFYFAIYQSWREKPENRDKKAWPLLAGFVAVEVILSYALVATT